MRRRFPLCALLLALLCSTISPRAAHGSWPDDNYTGWNSAGMAVPKAPFAPNLDSMIEQQCRDAMRQPSTDEQSAVVDAGWLLMAYEERAFGIEVIGGVLAFDAQCRPWSFNFFVFVDGELAGTLSPVPMSARTDKALASFEILDADRMQGTYDRYLPGDGLCCPSSQTEVVFTIERTASGPVLVPDGALTMVEPEGAASGLIPVCVGLGGDGLSLVQWTRAEVDDYIAEFGRITYADPATGTCSDLAGLPVGVTGAPLYWRCSRTAQGDWVGPYWIFEMYLLGTEVPPDPAIGGCPSPRSASGNSPTDTSLPAATAVYLSQLEAAWDADTLYAWMHPDAQAFIPYAAVAGWYRDNFFPLGPQQIKVTAIAFEPWTWEVTGTTYANTAVVSFTQAFADGTEANEVVRLVQDDLGSWRWFFGRTAEFVEQQITTYGQ